MAKIIGIGGASRSGKSSLAKKLKDHFASKRVLILDQDDFVKPDDQLPTIQNRTDWEHPETIDLPSLLSSIMKGSKNHDVVIVEGLLAFYFDELIALYDYTIFVQISKETFVFRRQQEMRWGTEPKWYLEHVWISHLIFGQYSAANFTILGENEWTVASLQELFNHIDL